MIERILVAVDDSPAGLAAGREAASLAARLGASLRIVHVLVDSEVGEALEASGGPEVRRRRAAVAPALFRHVLGLVEALGARAEVVQLQGAPARLILDQARRWPADLVVIGRGSERGVGGRYVGRETRIVLEFSEQPVLVVPAPSAR